MVFPHLFLRGYSGIWGMPGYPGFEHCLSFWKSILISGRHSRLLRFLGDIHRQAKYKICFSFKSRSCKNREIKFKLLMMKQDCPPTQALRIPLYTNLQAHLVPLYFWILVTKTLDGYSTCFCICGIKRLVQ